MRSISFFLKLTTAVLCGSSTFAFSDAIIGAGLRNGDFESVLLSPWGGGEKVDDSSVAAKGKGAARLVGNPFRCDLFHFFPAPPVDRRFFVVTYQAKAGAIGFANPHMPSLGGRRQDGSFIYATRLKIVAPSAVSTEWERHTYLFEFTEEWARHLEFNLSLGFSGGIEGSTAFIDDVILVQLPAIPPRGELLLTTVGDEVVVSFDGILQMNEDLSNPMGWADVNPVPSAPWVVPSTWRKRFFRIRDTN